MPPFTQVSTVLALKKLLSKEKNSGRSIGFVPTMGALHDGHRSLIEKAKKENDRVVASIFVNRLQFRRGGYKKYPRNKTKDISLLKESGCDILFIPAEKEIYPEGFSASVTLPSLIKTLKPQKLGWHYRGVLLVVAKLFNIVEPTSAYFGLKDPQQLALIEKMVDDLNFPIKIKGCKTIREKDGLAKSSRNLLLSKVEREKSAVIYRSLLLGKSLIKKSGITKKIKAINEMKRVLGSAGKLIKAEQIDIVDARTLSDLTKSSTEILISVAVKIGSLRLTDNIRFKLK